MLAYSLSAIGWQCHPAGTEVLLKFRNDERAFVRYIVANNLLQAQEEGREPPAEVANALLAFANDTDGFIRGSVFWDVAEFPTLFAAHRGAFNQAARSALQDPLGDVREQARRALEALG